MNVRLYIVTYKGFERLTQTLESLFSSDLSAVDIDVTLINNHSDFRLEDKFEDRVSVIHNSPRPDWSNGHLSRNWNQALLNGFERLDDPACDIVVAAQDDTIYRSDWIPKLLELHEEYSLVQNGLGDQFVSYTPEAVRNIGLWDERFIFSYHAADYFYRSAIYNKEDTCINDPGHNRALNPIYPDDLEKSSGYLVNEDPREIDEGWDQSSYSVKVGEALMENKYSGLSFEEVKSDPQITPMLESYVFYPYFEKDVSNLARKNYLWEDSWRGDQESGGLWAEQKNLMRKATVQAVILLARQLGIKDEVKWVRNMIRKF